MSQNSAIEWTEATWNPVTGCDRISPGCDNCYAMTLAARLKRMGQPRYRRDGDPRTSGPGFGLTLHPDKLNEPRRWRKPRTVFVNSMSDLFHKDVPPEFIWDVFETMRATPRHTYQVLTKRPKRMRNILLDFARTCGLTPAGWAEWHPNVWLGTSIESREYVWRADRLREAPASVRFISAEPLLGPLIPHVWESDLEMGSYWPGAEPVPCGITDGLDLGKINWLIVGGESGANARPMDPAWVRDLRDRCAESGTAFFFKQWGGIRPKSGGRLLDGRTWDEMPQRAAVPA